ncbi:MAG: hypothetical protein K6F05_02940 [Succinivibrio sp.]|nr:hypothetical protein [Succinivibrio sp.]
MPALLIGIFMLLLSGEALAVINAPAPPPELPDTLTDFRTKEQLEEESLELYATSEESEEAEFGSAPFVPGDDSSGVMRYQTVYTTDEIIGVPDLGVTVLRFYDVQGIPWEILRVQVETQGFSAEVTAATSELVLRQQAGAAVSRMVVELAGYRSPLIFTLRPVVLEQGGVRVSTILNAVRVQSQQNAEGYIFPQVKAVPEPNPHAEKPHFDEQTQEQMVHRLISAVRSLQETAPKAQKAEP